MGDVCAPLIRRLTGVGLVAAVGLALAVTTAPPAASSSTVLGTDSPGGQSSIELEPTETNVEYWDDVLLETFRRQGGGPGPLARAAAMMHVGMFDAINSATLSRDGSTPYNSYLTLQIVDHSVNENLATGYTARDLLIEALPQQRTYIEQKFTERYGSSYQAVARQLADTVVNAMRAARANDGSTNAAGYTPENVPGAWRPTDGCTAVTPVWGNVRPFAMTTTTQFRRSPPAIDYPTLLASSTYASQLAEVRSLGRNSPSTRTQDQTRAAWFWANDLDGTYKPPGHLLALTRIVSETGLTEGLDIARLFALVSLAMADAGIAAWDMKYLTSFDLWRPETAIQLASVNPDPSWEPLSADRNGVSFSPCFPAWVSGHATFAAAWAGIMRSVFGDNVTFTATTEDPHAAGVTRTFNSFTAAAAEDARSRIYLGVHYQFDADDGLATGYNIANRVYSNYLGPRV